MDEMTFAFTDRPSLAELPPAERVREAIRRGQEEQDMVRHWAKVRANALQEMTQTMRQTDIAAEFGVTPAAINKVLAQASLTEADLRAYASEIADLIEHWISSQVGSTTTCCSSKPCGAAETWGVRHERTVTWAYLRSTFIDPLITQLRTDPLAATCGQTRWLRGGMNTLRPHRDCSVYDLMPQTLAEAAGILAALILDTKGGNPASYPRRLLAQGQETSARYRAEAL